MRDTIKRMLRLSDGGFYVMSEAYEYERSIAVANDQQLRFAVDMTYVELIGADGAVLDRVAIRRLPDPPAVDSVITASHV